MSNYEKILSELLVRITAVENILIEKNVASNIEINNEIEAVAKKIAESYKKEKEFLPEEYKLNTPSTSKKNYNN